MEILGFLGYVYVFTSSGPSGVVFIKTTHVCKVH